MNKLQVYIHIRRVILVSAHQIQHSGRRSGRRFQLQISFLLVLQCTVTCRFYLSMSQILDLTSQFLLSVSPYMYGEAPSTSNNRYYVSFLLLVFFYLHIVFTFFQHHKLNTTIAWVCHSVHTHTHINYTSLIVKIIIYLNKQQVW